MKSNRNSSRLWCLLFLALILGGGSFLWQTTLNKALLDKIDEQLLLVAGSVEYLAQEQETRHNIPNLCALVDQLLDVPSIRPEIAIYSPSGEFLCSSSEHPTLLNPRQQQAAAEVPILLITGGDNGNHRRLLYPLHLGSEDLYQLSAATPLTVIENQMNRLRLKLLLASIVTLAITAFLWQRYQREQQGSCAELARWIESDDRLEYPSDLPQLPHTFFPEMKSLAERYHQTSQRMFSDLQRARQFTADVTHELRTPLTILRGETELALRKPREPEDMRKTLESNLEEINRMTHLIEDMLLLSKSDLGEVNLRLTSVNLEELLFELRHQAQILAEAKHIKVELCHDDGATRLEADELRIRQVLLNLISNAIRYTPEGGTVCIESSVFETQVEVSVSDNGIGMDCEHLQRIFDRFYRISNPHDGGTGLGLAIVKWIVTAHNGSIEVHSTPGVGSRFTVKIPLRQPST